MPSVLYAAFPGMLQVRTSNGMVCSCLHLLFVERVPHFWPPNLGKTDNMSANVPENVPSRRAYANLWQKFGDWKITSTSTERQNRSQNLAPVLVIISGNSLVFSRKIFASAGFLPVLRPGASAPVVVKNQSPKNTRQTSRITLPHVIFWELSIRSGQTRPV